MGGAWSCNGSEIETSGTTQPLSSDKPENLQLDTFLSHWELHDNGGYRCFQHLVEKVDTLLQTARSLQHDVNEARMWDTVTELGVSLSKRRFRQKVRVRVEWEKESEEGKKYGRAVGQLLENLEAEKSIEGGSNISTLYVCRSSTGRLSDIDKDKFLGIEGRKAVIGVRTGKNEVAFSDDHSFTTPISFLEGFLAVYIIIWEGDLVKCDSNASTVRTLSEFLRVSASEPPYTDL